MFWNKKDKAKVAKVDGLPITLSLRTNYTVEKEGLWHEKVMLERFLAYKTGDTWNGVVGYNEYKKKTDLLETKLDLILSHLKLKYVPDTETKQPAKLVEKTKSVESIFDDFITPYANKKEPFYKANFANILNNYNSALAKVEQPKKKGRPKKKE